MKIKERMKNAGFWVSIVSALFLILGAFGIQIADATADTVMSALCSVLVVFGIVSDPTKGTGYLDAIGDDDDDSSVDMDDGTSPDGKAGE